MFIAAAAKAATKAAAETHWWDDWPKFAPGWLAFVITVGTLGHKWWTRRHRLALGPDEADVRRLLDDFKQWFDAVSRRQQARPWFSNEPSKKLAAGKARDLADRRSDKDLKAALLAVADSWDEIKTHGFRASEHIADLDARRAYDQEVQIASAKQRKVAEAGVARVKTALDRLNKLERRTIGRS